MRDNLNLVAERGPSVWDDSGADTRQRLGMPALLFAAGAAGFLIGSWLLYRSLSKARPLTPTAGAAPKRPTPPPSDEVTRESEQSFPASDAPSWTTGRRGGSSA